MAAHESPEGPDEIEDPSEAIDDLLEDWRQQRAEHERAVDDASELSTKQEHRGRRRALEYGITWIESSDREDVPLEAIKSVCGHLAGAATSNPELDGAGPIIGSRQSAFRDELQRMTVRSRELRQSIQEAVGEQPDIDDIRWVNDEVRENVANAWGYNEYSSH